MTRTSPRLLLLTTILGAALFASVPALAQDAGSDTEIEATASVPQSRLVERYAGVAGSDDAALRLIEALRSGGDFTVTEQVTSTTSRSCRDSATSMAVTTPPACAMAVATSPTTAWSGRVCRRIVIEYDEVVAAMDRTLPRGPGYRQVRTRWQGEGAT